MNAPVYGQAFIAGAVNVNTLLLIHDTLAGKIFNLFHFSVEIEIQQRNICEILRIPPICHGTFEIGAKQSKYKMTFTSFTFSLV